MSGGRRFDPSEVADVASSDDERRRAAETGRALDAVTAASDAHERPGFTDRVMAAVATEPSPRPALVVAAGLRGRHPGMIVGAVVDAWRVVVGGAGRPVTARVGSAGVLVAAALSLGLVGGLLAGTASWLSQPNPPLPTSPIVSPLVSPPPATTREPGPTPSPSPTRTSSPEPSDSAEPSETPEPSGPEPTESEDHAGSGGSGGTNGAGSNETPDPTSTVRPSSSPVGSDDHEDHAGSTSTPQPSATPRSSSGGDG